MMPQPVQGALEGGVSGQAGTGDNLSAVLEYIRHGQVAKWLNAADCRSAGFAFGGSNPSLPTNSNAHLAQW